MDSILEIVESRIQACEANSSFTYLKNGEDDSESISMSQIRALALNMSASLPRDAPVLIMLPQGLSFLSALFGCLYSGAIAVPVPIPAKFRGGEILQKILENTRSPLLITNRSTHSKITRWFSEELLKNVGVVFVEDFNSDEMAGESVNLWDSTKPALLQYTSGTTGNPKGVVITHGNIVANAGFIKSRTNTVEKDCVVSWLPCFHDLGLIGAVFHSIYSNARVVMMSPAHFIQKPVRWFSAITKYNGTITAGPNFAFDHCTARIKPEELESIDLSSLHSVYNGSEPIQLSTLDNFIERFSSVGFKRTSILNSYGLAESTLAVTIAEKGEITTLRLNERALNGGRVEICEGGEFTELVSCGQPDPGTKLRIVRKETLSKCDEMEIGEILVSGKTVAAGYYRDKDQTNETFITLGSERFLRTGDLGFLKDGRLFVTGRIKDLIIIRGKNHAPQDIEKTVSESDDSIRRNAGAAFSVRQHSEEKLVIVQELKRSHLRNSDFDKTIARIQASVSRDHGIQPNEIVLVQQGVVPKTTSGKIKRAKTRELWRRDELNELAKGP